jgi:hypothetical protein
MIIVTPTNANIAPTISYFVNVSFKSIYPTTDVSIGENEFNTTANDRFNTKNEKKYKLTAKNPKMDLKIRLLYCFAGMSTGLL